MSTAALTCITFLLVVSLYHIILHTHLTAHKAPSPVYIMLIYCLNQQTELVSGPTSVVFFFCIHLRNPFPFHFRVSFTWQSGCSDQRRESRAVARFVSSRSVTQLQLPNRTEANTHPNVATSKES